MFRIISIAISTLFGCVLFIEENPKFIEPDSGTELELTESGEIPFCGNNIIEGIEECEMQSLNGEGCQSQGFKFGELKCNPDCTFSLEDCWVCGDGEITGIEQCEGNDFEGLTCNSFGLGWGEILCSELCEIDLSHCSSVECVEGSHFCNISNDNCCPGYVCDFEICVPE